MSRSLPPCSLSSRSSPYTPHSCIPRRHSSRLSRRRPAAHHHSPPHRVPCLNSPRPRADHPRAQRPQALRLRALANEGTNIFVDLIMSFALSLWPTPPLRPPPTILPVPAPALSVPALSAPPSSLQRSPRHTLGSQSSAVFPAMPLSKSCCGYSSSLSSG